MKNAVEGEKVGDLSEKCSKIGIIFARLKKNVYLCIDFTEYILLEDII